MVEGDDGGDPTFVTPGADAAVVIEGGHGELALGRLDPAPLEGEPVGAETEIGHHVDVLGPAVKRIAAIATGVDATVARRVLPLPPVVVDVPTLDLVGGGRRPPQA